MTGGEADDSSGMGDWWIKTHKRLNNCERFLIWTRQNNVQIFDIVMLPLTKRRTDARKPLDTIHWH